jgi:hypothetical protein
LCWETRSMCPKALERTTVGKFLGSALLLVATRLPRCRSDLEVHSTHAMTEWFAKRTKRADLFLLPARPALPRHVSRTIRGADVPSGQIGGLRRRLERASWWMGIMPIMSCERVCFCQIHRDAFRVPLKSGLWLLPIPFAGFVQVGSFFQFRDDFLQGAPGRLWTSAAELLCQSSAVIPGVNFRINCFAKRDAFSTGTVRTPLPRFDNSPGGQGRAVIYR